MRTMIGLLLLAVLAVAGCAPPAGVTNALATADQTLISAETDAVEAQVYPWSVPLGETQDQLVTRLEAQVIVLRAQMKQVSRNLDTVVDYFNANRLTDPATVGGD